MRSGPKVPPGAAGIRAPVLAACLALGCGHTEPFSTPPYGSDLPFDPGTPARLTYNGAADRGAFWLPDGTGLLYSAQQADRPDADVCLALLPPTGGSQRALWCDVPDGPARTDAIESGAVSGAGHLAFVSATGTIGGVNPVREAIVAASTLDPESTRIVRAFPYTPSGGSPHNSAEHLRWLDDLRLVYVGQQFATRQPCPLCAVDTFRLGREVTLVQTALPGSIPTALPGTSGATGVAADPLDADAVYYTLGGDSRIYRHTLSTGTVLVVHDFGAAGIARDIHVAAGRLAAVVGGRVAFGLDPQFGPTQWDSGGILHVLDLTSLEDVTLELGGDRLYRRPALAPGGDALVAEGYPLILTPLPEAIPFRVDTAVSRSGDLFRFGAP